jgi:ElaB/YqjD/DUF883 family membrane-anchored ribosome-binding protein
MKTNTALPANGGIYRTALESGVETATASAHHGIDSLADAARPALDNVASGAHGAVDRVGSAAVHAAGSLGEKGDQLNVSGKKIAERAGFYIREHPLASLGIAMASGYVLSRLLSSSR